MARERRCKGNRRTGLKKREKEKKKGKEKRSLLRNRNSTSRESYAGNGGWERKFTKIYCTISPAGKRSFGKNLTIETKFLNNIYRNEERNFSSSLLAPNTSSHAIPLKSFSKINIFVLTVSSSFERERFSDVCVSVCVCVYVNHSYIQIYT